MDLFRKGWHWWSDGVNDGDGNHGGQSRLVVGCGGEVKWMMKMAVMLATKDDD